MVQLGEFGDVLDPDSDEARDFIAREEDLFLFHGEEFYLPSRLSALPLLRFAREARDIDNRTKRLARARVKIRNQEDERRVALEEAELRMQEQASLYDYLRAMLTEDQWERFYEVSMAVGADLGELMSVANRIITAVVARPTRQSIASQDGLPTIPSGSVDGSPSGGEPTSTPVPSPPEPTPESGDGTPPDPLPDAPTQQPPSQQAPSEPVAVSDEQAAAALGISPREAQRRRWASEMVPVEEAGSML